jgi:hypothetical protein
MLGWGSLSPEGVIRRGLETATSGTYRAEHRDEFEQIVSWRLADSPSGAAYYEQARAGAGFDLSQDVGHITSPTLVIHGAEDRYVPVANAAALAGTIPGARLRVLDHAGHLVFIERFADVNREVVSFLKPRGSRKQERGQGTNALRTKRPARALGWIREMPRALVGETVGQHLLSSLAGRFWATGTPGRIVRPNTSWRRWPPGESL